MIASREWQVYALVCPVTWKVRYIGITSGSLQKRLMLHLRGKDHNKEKSQWIAWLRPHGLLPLIIPIDSIIGTRAQAERLERYWAYEYIKAGHDLLNTNHTPGSRELFYEFLRSEAL